MVNVDIKQVNIVIEAGADYQMYFVLRDNSNNLIDLTGAVVEAQLREFPEAQDYLQFTATHNGSGGRVSISMPHEDTSAIPYTSGVYDVFITDTDNVRDKYLTGEVAVIPSVTKPVAGEVIYLLSFASEDDFPSYGMVRRLYFSHASNHIYRWNGTDYVDIVTDGEAATVEVGDVETLPAGSDATVENVGSLLNAVFDFGIPEGNGIASIEKTGTDVLTDTYTVTFTDPSVEAFDFDVTNGKGIVSIAEVVSGLTHTFTVTFNDGDTFAYTLTDGNGIVSIVKTGATDNVDHYRITFDDGTYFDYNVTNVDTSEFYDKDEIDTLLADKADVGDSYTKDEEDALLADKADSADLGDLASKDTVDWDSDIDNIPSTFPPEEHNHDDRYYTETEMDSLLADKADADDVYTKDDVDDALDLKADSADVYTKTETDTLLLDKAPVILSSASGSIASFSDGCASPVTALSVGIEPVQDLHGYDNPWPAGGGANKFDVSTVTNQMLNISNGQSGDNVNWQASDFIPMVEGSVTLTWESSSNYFQANLCCYDSTKTFISDSGVSASKIGYSNTFAVVSGTAYIRFSYSVVVSGSDVPRNNIRLNIGTSDLCYQPYSNVCPISGHTSAVVTRTGKNLIEGVVEHALGLTNNNTQLMLMSNAGTCLKFRCKSGVTYTVSGCPDMNRYMAGIFDSDPNIFDVGTRETITSSTATSFTFTASKTGICLAYVANSVIDTSTAIIELGSSATAYEAPQIQQVTIDLDGTRYGGVLDVLTGMLTVDRVKEHFDKNTTRPINYSHADGYNNVGVIGPTNAMKSIGASVTSDELLCDKLQTSNQNYLYGHATSIGISAWWNTAIGVATGDASVTSVDLFKDWLGDEGIDVVYPLATPLTVTLTPSQLSTLLGTNNIWADTGDTSVEYRADTKLFIEGQIAETLDSVKKAKQIITDVTTEMVAPRNLAEGDYVIVGDDLLKTTATVASGSTLTIGINCVKTTVAEALIALATASE